MIKFNLKCAQLHEFEAWFRDNAAYDSQATSRKILCPLCGSRKVEKSIMAPRIAKARKAGTAQDHKLATGEALKALHELRAKVEENCDYVGENFAEEARKIHYGESDKRGIYGESTAQEARELAEEGIEFGQIPWVPRHDS